MNAIIKTEEVLVDGFSFPMYRTESGELVMADLDIGMALGLAQPINVRKVIRAHTVELVEGGTLFSRQERSGGRVGLAFFLTESQALYIAAKCRTKAAAAQLKRLISVYMLARKGDGAGAVAAAGDSTKSPRLSGGDDPHSFLIAAIRQNATLANQQLQLAEQQMRTDAELAQVASFAADLGCRVREIEHSHARGLAALATPDTVPMAPELPGITMRTHTVNLLKWVAFMRREAEQVIFNECYKLVKDNYHFDVGSRMRKARQPKIDIIEKAGHMEWMWAAANSMAKPYRQTAVQRIGHA